MVLSGVVVMAGGIGIIMAAGVGVANGLKWFNSYEMDFSGRKRNEGYSPNYNRDEDRRNHLNSMRRNNSSTTNIK